MVWYRNRHVDEWNNIKYPEINPHTYGHLMYDNEAKTIQWQKESTFNKLCWSKCTYTCRREQVDTYLSAHTKQKKCIKHLNVKLDTLNSIEEKVENTLKCIGI